MNILFYILFSVALLFLFFSLFFTYRIYKLTKINQTKTNLEKDFDERQLTSYELERLEREEEFDERINRLKEEIAEQHAIIRKGTIADELHPLVHNLPHEIVQTKYDVLPDVEIAD